MLEYAVRDVEQLTARLLEHHDLLTGFQPIVYDDLLSSAVVMIVAFVFRISSTAATILRHVIDLDIDGVVADIVGEDQKIAVERIAADLDLKRRFGHNDAEDKVR